MVSPTKLYKTVSQMILAGIQSGRFGAGDRLPTERELAAEHNVSRNTIREALIALEAKGWIEITQGRGVKVLRTTGDAALTFADSEIGSFKLLEARRLIEGEVCALAAGAITSSSLKRLEDLLVEMSDPDRETAEQADREFHLTIAQATENEALVVTIETLWDWRYWSMTAKQLLVDLEDGGTRDRVVEHSAILDALRTGSAIHARRAMRDHLDSVRDHLLRAVETAAILKVRDVNSRRRTQLSERAKSVDA